MSGSLSDLRLFLLLNYPTVNGKFRGSLTGISIGMVTQTDKIWRSFQALGDIAFAYSYSMILIEIQVIFQILRLKYYTAASCYLTW